MSGPDGGAQAGEQVFHERLVPTPATWLIAPGLGAGSALVVWPVDPRAAVAAALVLAAAAAVGLWQVSPVVAVRAGRLHAGRAQVPLEVLGEVSQHRGEDARHERGPGLDARAYLCIRGWVDPVVRVRLDDPADPTPYWLVSTRRPAELGAVLGRCRGGGRP